MPLPALIPLVAKAVAAAAPAVIGWLSAERTNQTNRELSEQQMQHEENMMDKQNAYNTPANQAERMRQAGLNPSAIGMSGGMSVAGNVSASPNGYQLPAQVDPFLSVSNGLLNLASGFNQEEEGRSKRTFRSEQLEQIRQQNEKYRQEIVMLGLDQRAQQISNSYADAVNEISLNEGAARIDKTRAEINEINQRIEESQQYILTKLPEEVRALVLKNKLNVLEQDKIVAEIQRTYAQTANLEQDTELKLAQEATENVKQRELSTSSNLNEEQAKSVQQQIQLYLDTWDEQIRKIAAESKLSERECKWYVVNQILNGVKSLGNVGAGAAAVAKVFFK